MGEVTKVKIQRVYIKLGNGKVAIFSGPAIFTKAELTLMQGKIEVQDIAFSEPFDMEVNVPKGEPSEPKQSPKQ